MFVLTRLKKRFAPSPAASASLFDLPRKRKLRPSSIGLKEYQRAGELLNQLVDRNATLAAQVAAAKEVVRNDLELLGTRATRILALEEMMGRCLAAWQNNPSWDNRELLAEAQALLN